MNRKLRTVSTVLVAGASAVVIWEGVRSARQSPPGAHIQAVVTGASFTMPPRLAEAIDSLQESQGKEAWSAFLKEFEKEEAERPESIRREVPDADDASVAVHQRFINRTWDTFRYKDGWWRFNLQGQLNVSLLNDGDRKAEGIVLEVGSEGFAEVKAPDGKKVNSWFEKRIDVGELKPGESMSVRVWTRHKLATPGRIFIFHDHGSSYADLPRTFTGFSAWLAKSWHSLIGFLIGAAIWIACVIFFSKVWRFIQMHEVAARMRAHREQHR